MSYYSVGSSEDMPCAENKMSKDKMKAVVFHGKLDVRLEDRPMPKIIAPTDVIVKVRYSALCGRQVFPQNTITRLNDSPHQ